MAHTFQACVQCPVIHDPEKHKHSRDAIVVLLPWAVRLCFTSALVFLISAHSCHIFRVKNDHNKNETVLQSCNPLKKCWFSLNHKTQRLHGLTQPPLLLPKQRKHSLTQASSNTQNTMSPTNLMVDTSGVPVGAVLQQLRKSIW